MQWPSFLSEDIQHEGVHQISRLVHKDVTPLLDQLRKLSAGCQYLDDVTTYRCFNHTKPILGYDEISCLCEHGFGEDMQLVVISGQRDVQTNISWNESVSEGGKLCVVREFGKSIRDQVGVDSVKMSFLSCSFMVKRTELMQHCARTHMQPGYEEYTVNSTCGRQKIGEPAN